MRSALINTITPHLNVHTRWRPPARPAIRAVMIAWSGRQPELGEDPWSIWHTAWEDAAEMILAGATSVTVGTANFYDPTAAQKVARGLESWAREQGVSDINELIEPQNADV